MSDSSVYPSPSTASFVHRTALGELRIVLPAPSVVLLEYEGYSDESFVDFIEKVSAEMFRHPVPALHIFVDTERQTGHTSGFRARMMKWSRQVARQTETSCYLVKSRWIAMGIAILNASVGLPGKHTEVTTSRDAFRAKLDSAVSKSIDRPKI